MFVRAQRLEVGHRLLYPTYEVSYEPAALRGEGGEGPHAVSGLSGFFSVSTPRKGSYSNISRLPRRVNTGRDEQEEAGPRCDDPLAQITTGSCVSAAYVSLSRSCTEARNPRPSSPSRHTQELSERSWSPALILRSPPFDDQAGKRQYPMHRKACGASSKFLNRPRQSCFPFSLSSSNSILCPVGGYLYTFLHLSL